MWSNQFHSNQIFCFPISATDLGQTWCFVLEFLLLTRVIHWQLADVLVVGRLQVFLCYIVSCTHLIISFSTHHMPVGVELATSLLEFTKLPTLRVLPSVVEFMKFSLQLSTTARVSALLSAVRATVTVFNSFACLWSQLIMASTKTKNFEPVQLLCLTFKGVKSTFYLVAGRLEWDLPPQYCCGCWTKRVIIRLTSNYFCLKLSDLCLKLV